jgi:F-type H+-transporting ATPase subunit delta
MSSFNISTRYANAFMELAEEKNVLDKVADDMVMLEKTLSDAKDLKTVLKSPVINKEKKEAILNEIFSGKVDDVTLHFLLFVNNKNRENLLPDIVKRFNNIRNVNLNRAEAEIISSVELSDNQKNIILNQLKIFSNKEILPEYKVDESLIGGFTVKIGDTVIDSSVKQKLIKLRKNLVTN